MIKVSVILPSLNVADYIEACMDSVLGQTLEELEVICVDAGSSDGTREILRSYAARDRRVRLLESGEKSYGAQVNLGISAARGEYIGIVETDDSVSEDMYRVLYEAAQEEKPDLVKADWEELLEAGGRRAIFPVSLLKGREGLYGKICSVWEEPWLFLRDMTVWKGIYRRSFLEEKRLRFHESPGAAFQDMGFSILSLSMAETILYVRRPLYRYRRERPGASSQNPNVLRFVCQEWQWLLEEGLLPERARECPCVWQRMADSFLGEYEKALRSQEYDRRSPFIAPYYPWLRRTLLERAESLAAPSEPGREERYRRLMLALWSPDRHAELLRQEDAEAARLKSEMIRRAEGRKIVIFGCGARGRQAVEMLFSHRMEAEAFCDNRRTLWGTRLYGLPVFSPQECASRFPRALYLTAAKGCQEDMRGQLMELGIPEEQVLAFLEEASLCGCPEPSWGMEGAAGRESIKGEKSD